MLNVVMLNVILLNVVMLSVILLNVTAPLLQLFDGKNKKQKKLIKCWIEKNVSGRYYKTFYLYQDTQRRHL